MSIKTVGAGPLGHMLTGRLENERMIETLEENTYIYSTVGSV